DLSVDEISLLKTHVVSGDYIAGIAQSGIGKLRPEMLIALKQHDVRPEYVRGILALGFGPYSIPQFIAFKNQGVPIELFAALKDYGLLHADPADIREARLRGVGSQSLRDAKQYSAKLSLK